MRLFDKDMEVTNESESEIAILYATDYESAIGAGETKEEIYKFECFRVKTEGQLYEYKQVRPPDSYFDTGVSSSTIYAVFTKEKEFKIYIKGGSPSDTIELKRVGGPGQALHRACQNDRGSR